MNCNVFKYLYDTKGKPIPFEYKVLYNIPLNKDELIYNGNLLLISSYINYLPDNLTINGSLFVCWSDLIILPNNLTINGILDINRTNISDLPDNLYVKGKLWCIDTPLSKRIKNDVSLLKKYRKQIKGKIYF